MVEVIGRHPLREMSWPQGAAPVPTARGEEARAGCARAAFLVAIVGLPEQSIHRIFQILEGCNCKTRLY
jgi:hypothetical protein